MKQYFETILRLAKYLTKAFTRDRVALFFTFVFPLIFLLVFGALNKRDGGVSFDIAIINNSQTQFARSFEEQSAKSEFMKIKPVESLDEAKDLMGRGGLDSILVLPQNFGELNDKQQPTGKVQVYYNPSSEQTGQTFAQIVDGTLREIDAGITKQRPLFAVQTVSTDTKGLSSFDYIFAGLLGFSILSLGFFGPTNSLPSMKKTGALRRLRTTPLRTSQFVLGNAINYLLIGLATTAFLFVVGMLVFDFTMQGDYLSFGLIVALGTVMMFGFGLAVGGWAKNENQAAPLTNLVAFPMMFLSGVFFPRFLMPEWLQNISGFLPLTPLIDAIRHIIVEGQTIFAQGPELALMAIWTIVIYTIAFRVFRWE